MVRPFKENRAAPPTASATDESYRYTWNEREQRAVPIAIDSPPASPQVIETNQYVPYETARFQNAYAWAGQQVARKFPYAVETLSTLDSLIEQQLNATKE